MDKKDKLSEEKLKNAAGGRVVVNPDGTYSVYDDSSDDILGEYTYKDLFGTTPGKSVTGVSGDGSH